MAVGMKNRRVVFLLAAFAMAAFVSVAESRTGPMEKTSQEADGVKKPDCVPAFDPRSFPGHGGTTTPVVPGHGGSGSTPSHGGSGGYGTTPTAPSHGGSGTLPAPSHGGAAPSHGGGYGTSPVMPSPGGGYGGGSPTPSHGGGAYGSSPSTAPSHGGGSYGGGSSPTPSHGGGAYGGGAPTTPSSHDSHGLVPVDPTSPGTCDYWRSHPMEMWSALGRWPSSVGHFFGAAAGGTGMTIQDALSNTRGDGAGALLREGAAALLNSMTRSGFPYTTEQVRNAFAAAAAAGGSDSAAAAQAAAFKKANEGRA
ncbi:hypothetical protein E2562_000574 [Oryza meyeriana var. granulata]|uniref:Meiosis 5 n=1 Tax=Oryza meyeriana var. granulata TaxID=110450 RepID=A0A6G1DSX6_9ORYZ|nr:hypothetical protein E2562_000574 [Oryza meyeriana var. granulata]